MESASGLERAIAPPNCPVLLSNIERRILRCVRKRPSSFHPECKHDFPQGKTTPQTVCLHESTSPRAERHPGKEHCYPQCHAGSIDDSATGSKNEWASCAHTPPDFRRAR